MIKVGIYWAIYGKVFPYIEERADELDAREKLSGKIDSKKEHFIEWDKELAKIYPHADFATYPRGRVMFDTKNSRHIIYADKCVGQESIDELTKVFDISNYVVERDDHYRCDKCMKHKEPSLLSVDEDGDSFKVLLVSENGAIKRTFEKGVNDEFAFEDILNETKVTEHNGELVCKFIVEQRPSSAFSSFFLDNTGIVPQFAIKDEIAYKIIDGENRIGANLIEVSTGKVKILVECGTELEPTTEGEELRDRITQKHYDACFVSHYHGDHAGLLNRPINCDCIYMGEKAFAVLSAIGGVCEENASKVRSIKSEHEYAIGDITCVPYLCDHSAYDSYMLLFKTKSSSILYTGDFRSNGRKNFGALLSRLPEYVDTIICEGTNLSHDLPQFNETDLEQRLVELFSSDKPMFVLQSSTNIDRIVSVYRAAVRTDRNFVMRAVQARICELLPNIPRPTEFKRCYTYPDPGMSNEEFDKIQSKYGTCLVGKNWLSKHPRFVLEVPSWQLSNIKKLSEMMDLKGSTLVYSMWWGYTEKEDMQAFLAGVTELGINIEYIHTSGHADKQTIDALLNRVRHRQVRFVHKEKWMSRI